MTSLWCAKKVGHFFFRCVVIIFRRLRVMCHDYFQKIIVSVSEIWHTFAVWRRSSLKLFVSLACKLSPEFFINFSTYEKFSFRERRVEIQSNLHLVLKFVNDPNLTIVIKIKKKIILRVLMKYSLDKTSIQQYVLKPFVFWLFFKCFDFLLVLTMCVFLI